MRSFTLFLSFGLMVLCNPDNDRYPPGSSGPAGPGIGHGAPVIDAGPSPDSGVSDAGAETSFNCGDEVFTCEFADGFANCCDWVFVECPADFPYYCPSDAYCWFEDGLCADNATCTMTGISCE